MERDYITHSDTIFHNKMQLLVLVLIIWLRILVPYTVIGRIVYSPESLWCLNFAITVTREYNYHSIV